MQEAKSTHPYVEINRKICNGSPVIKGTRVRIVDIVIEYEHLNHTPDEIISAHTSSWNRYTTHSHTTTKTEPNSTRKSDRTKNSSSSFKNKEADSP